jgi:PAS domain S-box-containing protein
MMDPVQQPTPDGRDSTRNQRDNDRRQERTATPKQIGDRRSLASRSDDFGVVIEKLRIAEEETRVQNEELIASRQAIDLERLRYRELFDFAPDAYVTTDGYGNIREANLAAGKMLGVDPKFLPGKPLPVFLAESGRREYRQQLDRLCDSDRLDDWETVIRPRGGEQLAVSVSIARSHRKTPDRAGYRWILRDITKRVQAEEKLRELNRELEQRVASRTTQLATANRVKDELLVAERHAREEAERANRVKADFLALLSHEFRTPLQAIFGYTELLEREIHGPLNEAQLRDLRRIQQSQRHLLGLITTILDFARLDSGQEIGIDLCDTAVHEILRGMEGFIGSQLEMRKLTYSYECSDERLIARADPAKLQQIVLNLLANAIKFTPAGGSVTLQCEPDGDSAAIRVVDTGIGIPADKLEAIFQPFVQIRRRDVSTEGTGLGLPISRRLAAAMGGTLCASSWGSGSIFTLRVPLAKKAALARPA